MSKQPQAGMKEIMNRLFDGDVRAESILHLGAMCMADAFPGVANDAFDDEAEEVYKALGWGELEDDYSFNAEDIGERLRTANQLGFLAKFATPVPTEFHGKSSYSTNGWGYYTTKWFYSDTFDGACEQALKWVETYIEMCGNKAAKKKGPRR